MKLRRYSHKSHGRPLFEYIVQGSVYIDVKSLNYIEHVNNKNLICITNEETSY